MKESLVRVPSWATRTNRGGITSGTWVRLVVALYLGCMLAVPATAQEPAASVHRLLGIAAPWGALDTTWYAAIQRAGWSEVPREGGKLPSFTGEFLGRTMRLSAYSDGQPRSASDNGRRITWLVLVLPVDSAAAPGVIAALADSLSPVLGMPVWGPRGEGRLAALRRGLLLVRWPFALGSRDEVSISGGFDNLIIAFSSEKHQRAFAETQDDVYSERSDERASGIGTVEAEAAPEPWRVYEDWEVETPATLISCRNEAPPISSYGSVDIRLVVDAFGFATMPTVAPSSRFDLTRFEEDALEEWVKHSCRFLAAQKRGTSVQSRFTLTVRYR